MLIETTLITETLYDKIIRHLTLGGVIFVVGVILREYKVWNRVTERVDEMYCDFCIKHGLKYDRVRNGNK